jgi:hypothetical protein
MTRYLDAPDTVHGDEAARLLDTLLLLQLQQKQMSSSYASILFLQISFAAFALLIWKLLWPI